MPAPTCWSQGASRAMPFQFLCPQGHLLQGDEAHTGMQTHCPQCGVLFIIPIVPATQTPAGVEPARNDESENRWPDNSPGGMQSTEDKSRSPQNYLGSLAGGTSPAQKQNDAGIAGAT